MQVHKQIMYKGYHIAVIYDHFSGDLKSKAKVPTRSMSSKKKEKIGGIV